MNHGVDLDSNYFKAWLVGVPLIYFTLLGSFRLLGLWDFQTRKKSRASDIMAFEIVAGICVTYLGIAGIIGYYSLLNVQVFDKLVDDKFYGRSDFVVNHLIYPMICYQGWNLLLCFLNADLRDPAMIGHHAVTGTLAYFGLHPYLHFYGLFYFGVAELTNIPLTIVDIFKYYPDMKKHFPVVNEVARISFAVSFIILRLIIWPFYSYPFWVGSFELLFKEAPHSYFVVGFFLFANIFLTGLQFFWGSKIFGFLFKSEKETGAPVKQGKKAA